MNDLISRQAVKNALVERTILEWEQLKTCYPMLEAVDEVPTAQPEYEPVTVEDFAKTMSENTLYGFMAWHGEAFTLIKEMGFEICKKTM